MDSTLKSNRNGQCTPITHKWIVPSNHTQVEKLQQYIQITHTHMDNKFKSHTIGQYHQSTHIEQYTQITPQMDSALKSTHRSKHTTRKSRNAQLNYVPREKFTTCNKDKHLRCTEKKVIAYVDADAV